jgi:hypothetical protein
MIAIPRHFVAARSVPRPSAPRRTAFALLAALMLLLAPSTAMASAGGVAVDPGTTAAAASTSASAPAATSAKAVGPRPKPVGKALVKRAQTLLRLTATGKHDTATRKVVKRFQRLRGIAPFGIIDVATYTQVKDAFALLSTGGASLVPTTDGGGVTPSTTPPTPTLPANLAPITAQERAILDKIAKCESEGDPTATSGKFRGKYQFDVETWKTVGGSGDPAAASEIEQDQRAAILLRQRGTAPWPVCGK